MCVCVCVYVYVSYGILCLFLSLFCFCFSLFHFSTVPFLPSIQVEDAEQQLEFLREIQSTIGKNADLAFLSALMGSRKGAAADVVVAQLDEAAQMCVIPYEMLFVVV